MYFEIESRTIGALDESFLAVPGSLLGSEALSQALGPTPPTPQRLEPGLTEKPNLRTN